MKLVDALGIIARLSDSHVDEVERIRRSKAPARTKAALIADEREKIEALRYASAAIVKAIGEGEE